MKNCSAAKDSSTSILILLLILLLRAQEKHKLTMADKLWKSSLRGLNFDSTELWFWLNSHEWFCQRVVLTLYRIVLFVAKINSVYK